MSLTDTAIRNAKPKVKAYKLADQKGLYLLVNKVGKYFRFDYRFAGKRKTLALGVYPDVKLQEARRRHSEARELLRNVYWIAPAMGESQPTMAVRRTSRSSRRLRATVRVLSWTRPASRPAAMLWVSPS